MKLIVTPVNFLNRNGCKLFGMLHKPGDCRHDPVIILLSSGIKSRVAPHRLYVKMANRFCEMGFMVLRMDPEGLGDSEGEIEEHLAADVYGSIEVGRLVNDTIDAMDWMQSNYGAAMFILSGLCGGAITGLLTGATDRRVVSLLGLGMTCIVSGSKTDRLRYLTQVQLDSLRKTYLRKVADPESLIRLLTFRTDYRQLIKSLSQPMSRWLKKYCSVSQKGPNEAIKHDSAGSNLNPHFPKAFLSFLRKRKMLLIFSGEDRLYWEFQEKFMSIYRDSVVPFTSNLTINVINDANHIFSFSEWQDEMLRVSCEWLERELHGKRRKNQ
jgi:hypothetical protein